MIISEISALKIYPPPEKNNHSPQSDILLSHCVCLRAVATRCVMTLGQQQTLYVMVIFKDYIGAAKFLLPSSYTMPSPNFFLSLPF